MSADVLACDRGPRKYFGRMNIFADENVVAGNNVLAEGIFSTFT